MKYSDGTSSSAIAFCMAKFNSIEQSEFIKTFYNSCKKMNYKVFIFSSCVDFSGTNNMEAEVQIYELMEPERFDAVVILADSFKRPEIPEKIAKRVVESKTPCIALHADYPGCVSLHFAFEGSFEQVVRHIIEFHKAKNVNFIAGNKGNPYSEERLEVYKKVMRENRLEIEEDRIGYGDFWEQPTSEVMDRFLNAGKPIDAIICANDFMAIEVCRKLRETGLCVPEDIMVSGFDGVEIEKYHFPRLATAFNDIVKMSEMIVDRISELIKGNEVEEKTYVGCKFRAGQSCGCISTSHFEEDWRRMCIRTYEGYRRTREIESDMELLYEEIPFFGKKDKLETIWGQLFYYERRFLNTDFNLLINDDFLQQDLELWPDLMPFDEAEIMQYYTDYMRVAMNCQDGVFVNKTGMEREKLLPDIDTVFDKPGALLFMPVHVQGMTIGYATCRIIPGKTDLFRLLSLVETISNLLEMHKMRLDQKNLNLIRNR